MNATRNRSRQRGAAMVEGVVAIPFFLLMFAGIMYVGKLYETKMRVMRLTKESAWNYAMCNCGDKGDDNSTTCRSPEGATAGGGGSEGGKPEGFDPGEISKAGGAGPGGELASKQFGSSYASLEQKITADNVLGGFQKTMSSRTKVMCNERPNNGSLTGWGRTAFDALSKW